MGRIKTGIMGEDSEKIVRPGIVVAEGGLVWWPKINSIDGIRGGICWSCSVHFVFRQFQEFVNGKILGRRSDFLNYPFYLSRSKHFRYPLPPPPHFEVGCFF